MLSSLWTRHDPHARRDPSSALFELKLTVEVEFFAAATLEATERAAIPRVFYGDERSDRNLSLLPSVSR